ncbi:MAG: sugar-binding protein, partial [candidate division WOR-3 bacterium]
NFDKRMPIKLISDCYKAKSKITIDGRIIEKAWQNVEPLYVFGSSDGNIAETDPVEIYFAYDKSNLYIAGKITDYEPNKISASVSERDEDNIYQDDNINIILQPKIATDTYYQFFINPKGAVLDRVCYFDGKTSKRDKKWNSEINVKTDISTGEIFYGWTFEVALPLKQFDIIEPKTDWGFNLVRYQARTDKVSIYSVPFEHNPKTFATLQFSEK